MVNSFLPQQMFSAIKYIFHFRLFLLLKKFCEVTGLKICGSYYCSFSIFPLPLPKTQELVITDTMFSKLYWNQHQLQSWTQQVVGFGLPLTLERYLNEAGNVKFEGKRPCFVCWTSPRKIWAINIPNLDYKHTALYCAELAQGLKEGQLMEPESSYKSGDGIW